MHASTDDRAARLRRLAETVQAIPRDAEADWLAEGPPGPLATAPPRLWILVVEDDPRLRELWTLALSRAGYAVLGSEDGATALEMIRDFVPHFVLLDLRIPRLSGATALDTVRQHPVWNRIPIVIVSGHLEDEPQPTSGANPHIVGRLQKPVSLDTLLQCVRAVLEEGRPHATGRE